MVSMTNWPKFSEGDDPEEYKRALDLVLKQAIEIRNYIYKSPKETLEEKSFREYVEKDRAQNAERAKEINKDSKDGNVTSNEI